MTTGVTFDTLTSDLIAYLERGGANNDATVVNQLPSLINLAERRIATELKLQGMLESVTATMQDGVCVYPKPDRWRETVSINFGSGTGFNTRNPLYARSIEFIRSYWPDQTATAAPEYYADYTYSFLIFGPTPDDAYPFEIIYYALPPLLDQSNQSNWVTEYAPQLILYASLLETAMFIKNDKDAAKYQAQYDRALAAFNGQDMQKIIDRTAQRSQP